MIAQARFSTFNLLFRVVISPLKVLRYRFKFSHGSYVQIMCSTMKSFERLPTNVVPRNYGLTLQPNLTEFSFTGKEVIEVEVSIRYFPFYFSNQHAQTHSYSYNILMNDNCKAFHNDNKSWFSHRHPNILSPDC